MEHLRNDGTFTPEEWHDINDELQTLENQCITGPVFKHQIDELEELLYASRTYDTMQWLPQEVMKTAKDYENVEGLEKIWRAPGEPYKEPEDDVLQEPDVFYVQERKYRKPQICCPKCQGTGRKKFFWWNFRCFTCKGTGWAIFKQSMVTIVTPPRRVRKLIRLEDKKTVEF